MHRLRTVLVAVAGMSLLAMLAEQAWRPSMAQAETYVAGKFGVTFPQSFQRWRHDAGRHRRTRYVRSGA